MQLENPNEKLIIAVVQHKVWNYILVPYIVVDNIEKRTAQVIHRLTTVDFHSTKSNYSPEIIKILKILFTFDDNVLMKAYSKSNFLNEFLDKTSKPIAEKVIRPFIESKIAEVIPLLIEQNIPIFFKTHNKTLFYNDEISIAKENTEVVFNFNRDENGTEYFLTIHQENKEISLLNKDLVVLSNEPCIIILGTTLYNFFDIDSKKLLPFLTKKSIIVAKQNEKAYYDTFIRKVLHNQKVQYSGFEIIGEDLEKKAKLSIEKDLSGKIVLILKYYYDKASYFFDNTRQNRIVDFTIENDNYSFQVSQRNQAWEREIADFLLSRNLVSIDNKTFKLKDIDTDNEVEFLDCLTKISDDFSEKNIVLNCSLEKKYILCSPKINFEIKQSNDWFDIYANVNFGEFQLKFIQLKQNILNNNQEYILPNGSIAIIPIEWFAKYKELFIFGKITKDKIELSRLHSHILLREFKNKGLKFGKIEEIYQPIPLKKIQIPSEINENLPKNWICLAK